MTSVRFFTRDEFMNIVGEDMCKIWPFIFFSNINVSASGLALISLNRATAVWRPKMVQNLFSWKKAGLLHLVNCLE